jgi:ribosomal protein S18 acetylase RimI-like enzyme
LRDLRRSYGHDVPDLQLSPVSIDDAPVLHDLIRQAEVADDYPLVTPLVEVEEWFEGAHVDAAADFRLALVDGRPAGWARVEHEPSGVVLERAFVTGSVAPAHRRLGAGSALLSWGTQRARERLAVYDHDLPRYVRISQFDWVDDAARLYEAAGYEAVRWSQEMLRPLEDLPPFEEPDGVRIIVWDDTRREDARRAKNAAFADHWGSTPTTTETWSEWLDSHGPRLDLSMMALAGDEVVGVSLNEHYPDDEELLGRRDGWIQSLSVRREWRGRGVASALIVASMRAFAEVGFTHAALGVDTENLSGAVALYTRLGFEPTHRTVNWQLDVTPSPR